MNYYYSNIYWHFTGSPKNINWDLVFCPNDILANGSPKPDEECMSIVESILSSKKLFANTNEKVDSNIRTVPFCCVTDIPIQNLEEHKQYYGNIAIGFKHTKIHIEFNPVLYIPKKILPVKIKPNKQSPSSLLGGLNSGLGLFNLWKFEIDDEKLGTYFVNHIKLTSFSDNPSETFYREREWRKLGEFNFDYKDVSAIIIPESYLSRIRSFLTEIKADDISILTWELLKKL